MFLPPPQHRDRTRVQFGNRKWRPVECAGRSRCGQRDGRQIVGQADAGEGRAARGVRVDAGSLQCRKDLGRALIEHRNEQVLSGDRDADGVGEQ